MTEWKQVFRSKKRRTQDERWACTGCGAILDQSHHDTPKDGICKCGHEHTKSTSGAFRDGFDQVDWSKGKGPGQWVDIGGGVKRFVSGAKDEQQAV